MKHRLLRLMAVLLALSMIAAACGDDDDDGSADTDDSGLRRMTLSSASYGFGKYPDLYCQGRNQPSTVAPRDWMTNEAALDFACGEAMRASSTFILAR